MPHKTPEFAAIVAEMKALRQGLHAAIKDVSTKVDGVAGDVRDLRKMCRELFEAVLDQEIEQAKLKDRMETLEAEVTLLKKRGNGSPAAAPAEPA